MTTQALDLYAFRDHRAFLRAYYAQKKREGRGFSLRAFSRRIGLGSSNYLKLVMDGDRNLSAEMAARFAQGCRLEGRDADFFCELVAFGQAKTSKERERCHQRLLSFRPFRAAHTLDADQAEYHSHWYVPAIRELVACVDFREDPRWIASRLRPTITARKASQALALLLRIGVLVRDAEGKLVHKDSIVQTGEGPLPHQVASFHRTMIALGAQAIDDVPREERELGAVTLCVSAEQQRAIKAELRAFRDALVQRHQAGPDARRVVQVNFQMFPMTTWEND